MQVHTNKHMFHLDEVCSDYNMSASDIYNILISRKDEEVPLTFETIRHMVLKEIPSPVLRDIFTPIELKSIFSDTNIKKIKDKETKKFLNSIT